MATDRVTIRSAIREWWINDVNKPSWFRDDQNERLIDRVIDALDAAAAVRAEMVDIDIDEASRRLCIWLGYAWDGLRDDGRVTDHGYPPWHIPTVGGRAFQGRKEDIRDIVRAIVAAAERKEVMPSGQEAVSTEPIPPSDAAPPTAGPIPPAGALAGWKLFQEMLAAAPSPQPAPAEGAPDGARLMDVIKVLRGWADVGDFQQHERGVLRKAAAALTAQADEIVADMAEIAAGRERAEKAEAALAAKEAEIAELQHSVKIAGARILQGDQTIFRDRQRIAELEAALRPFVEGPPKVPAERIRMVRRALAALAGKEPQG